MQIQRRRQQQNVLKTSFNVQETLTLFYTNVQFFPHIFVKVAKTKFQLNRSIKNRAGTCVHTDRIDG